MHTAEVVIPPGNRTKIEKLKRMHRAQDERELLGWTLLFQDVENSEKREPSSLDLIERDVIYVDDVTGSEPAVLGGTDEFSFISSIIRKPEGHDIVKQEKLFDAGECDIDIESRKECCSTQSSEISDDASKAGRREVERVASVLVRIPLLNHLVFSGTFFEEKMFQSCRHTLEDTLMSSGTHIVLQLNM